MDRLGRVGGQHGRQVRIDHLGVPEPVGQGPVELPGRLPLRSRVLVAMRPDVVPGHQRAVRGEDLGDAAEHPVEVGDVMPRRVVDHQVEVALWPLRGVGVQLGVPQRKAEPVGLLPRPAQQVGGEVDPDRLCDQAGLHQLTLDPPVAAVEYQRLAERAAVVAGEMLRPRQVRVSGGAPVEVSLDGRQVVPVPGLVVDAAVRVDRAAHPSLRSRRQHPTGRWPAGAVTGTARAGTHASGPRLP